MQVTQNSKHNKWLEILAGENCHRKSSGDSSACGSTKTTSLSTAKAASSTQRPQTCTEAATRYYNYTVNETDEEKEDPLPKLQLKNDRRSGRSANG